MIAAKIRDILFYGLPRRFSVEIMTPPLEDEAAFVSNLVLIEQAVKESSYDRNHIAYLARKGFIKGEKHGGVWLIDLDSLKEYEAQMEEEGTKKYNPAKYKDKKAS